MKKITKYNHFVFFAFAFLIGLIYFSLMIYDFTIIEDISNLGKVLEGTYSPFYNSLVTNIVFHFLFGIGIIALITYIGLLIFKKKKEFNLVILSAFLLLVFVSSEVILSLTQIIGFSADGMDVGGENIAAFVFDILIVIALVTYIFLPKLDDKIRLGILGGTFFLFFVSTSLKLSVAAQIKDAENSFVASMLFFISLILPTISAFDLINKDVIKIKEISNNNVSTTNETKVSNQTKDPTVELKKLNELYKSGVITEEEYNEKRQKYVDEL